MFVITGGGSGIGRALAHALAAREQQVLIIGRRQHVLQETAAFSSQIRYCCADVTTEIGRLRIINYVENTPKLQGLVHSAGIIEPMLPLAQFKADDWHRVMATNVNAPLFLTQSLLPKLNQGRVMHIGSGAVYYPAQGWGAYCVSKAAIAMLSRCWQLECADVAFTNVMPGIVATEMVALIQHTAFMDEQRRALFRKLQQEKRLLCPQTVAMFLAWLLLETSQEQFSAAEWDIYDSSHHSYWLKAPHVVPSLE